MPPAFCKPLNWHQLASICGKWIVVYIRPDALAHMYVLMPASGVSLSLVSTQWIAEMLHCSAVYCCPAGMSLGIAMACCMHVSISQCRGGVGPCQRGLQSLIVVAGLHMHSASSECACACLPVQARPACTFSRRTLVTAKCFQQVFRLCRCCLSVRTFAQAAVTSPVMLAHAVFPR
jgi:hypothetical protein